MQLITHGRSALPSRCAVQMRPTPSPCAIQISHVRRLAPRVTAAGPAGAPSGTDLVGHVLQQHRLLLEAGFSYDQASLILRVSQHSAGLSSPAPLSEAQAAAGAPCKQQTAATLSSSSSSFSAAPASDEQQQQQQESSLQQQQQQLTALQERVSFLEMELLKQSLMIDAAAIAAPQAAAAAAAAGTGSEGWAAGEAPPSGPLPTGLQQPGLDPHVSALAEALAIRQALLSPTAAAALAASGALAGSADPQYAPRQPSGIWGRRRLQQLQAKPWRYRDGAAEPAAAAAGYTGQLGLAEQAAMHEQRSHAGAAAAAAIIVMYVGVFVTALALVG